MYKTVKIYTRGNSETKILYIILHKLISCLFPFERTELRIIKSFLRVCLN